VPLKTCAVSFCYGTTTDALLSILVQEDEFAKIFVFVGRLRIESPSRLQTGVWV